MKHFKWLDVPILIALFAIAGLLFASGSSSGNYIEIHADGGVYRYSLSDERTVAVSGPLGETIFQISGGQASIIDSPCPNKTCMRGHIDEDGGTLVCLPNRVIARLGISEDVDAASW